ncbi:MAG: 2-C-methyl-D-erythritol 4-phosphate cytidylyltransferase [Paludibacteraceae bacterium]|mgnify:FL=1|nr:2-C-methyl-D-erythritol 4-phosphate cytidylyltransferase [Paludibacteraceae bacterium]
MKKQVVVVAGGKGLRMNAGIPKQFIEVGGKPILMHTLERFHGFDSQIDIILVLPEEQFGYWKELCKKHNFDVPFRLQCGGKERFDSVKNGLQLVEKNTLVAVHDGVRPFVSCETLSRCFSMAKEKGNAVPVIDMVDSVRRVDSSQNSEQEDRGSLKLVQTPQVFLSDVLLSAYAQKFDSKFTDDASVVESIGENINLVEGNRENIKITTEFDLKIAQILLEE